MKNEINEKNVNRDISISDAKRIYQQVLVSTVQKFQKHLY